MSFQEIIVFILLIAAAGYGGSIFYRKVRSFSPKAGCADDCGCSSKSEKTHTAV